MKTQDFRNKWEKGLENYLSKIDKSRCNGFTRKSKCKEAARHRHIIDLKAGENELDVIKEYNVLDNKDDFEYLIGRRKVHQYARHLNSSQVMCYNFFRPMILVDSNKPKYGSPKDLLIRFVNEKIHVSISKDALCYFEYEDIDTRKQFKSYTNNKGRGEKSQFDFYIKDGVTELFFEIKYTESSFGKWPSDNNKISGQSIINHCSYIQNGYKSWLRDSQYFTEDCKNKILSFKESEFSYPQNPFNAQYQLFRNALRARDSSYSIFIFPAANPDIKREFEVFKKNLWDNQQHIIGLTWEDLKQYMLPEFIEKYISILE
ncbi:MAG: hypothetical protein IK103_05025 [Bacteroidales bacterium]|nr:hypothetical protein [Bacteroidales bacterium]